jgi:hypothetical protein
MPIAAPLAAAASALSALVAFAEYRSAKGPQPLTVVALKTRQSYVYPRISSIPVLLKHVDHVRVAQFTKYLALISYEKLCIVPSIFNRDRRRYAFTAVKVQP